MDTLGLPIAVSAAPADMHDAQGARRLLAGPNPFVPRLKKIWADPAYRGKALTDRCQQQGGWEPAVVEREPGMRRFGIRPRGWVVERRLAWLIRSRRPAMDDERKAQTGGTLSELVAIRLLPRRSAGQSARRASGPP